MKKQKMNALTLNKKRVSNLNTVSGGRPNYTHVPQQTIADDRCIVSAHYGCPDTFLNTCNMSEAGPSVCVNCPIEPAGETDISG